MNDQNNSTVPAPPSVAKLIKSTIIAICVAALILVTVVLPAEYGYDPTGVGESIGLLKMGQIKVSLSEEAADDRLKDNKEAEDDKSEQLQAEPAIEETDTEETNTAVRRDEVSLSLSPGQGKEIKLTMLKGAKVDYTWFTDGGVANFDAHADSKKLKIKYHSYSKGKKEREQDVLTAEFDGNHGWFWRNRTEKPMIVTLQVSGEYTDLIKYE